MTAAVAALGSVAAAAVTAAGWRLLLRRLPEPITTAPKRLYADLANPAITSVVAALSAMATWITLTEVAPAMWAPWLVLSSVGVILAAIDGLTTWIPAVTTRVAWGLMAIAGIAMLPAGGGWTDLARMAVGAAAAWLLFLAVWLVTRGGCGFGDVRFIPLTAAPAAAISIEALAVTMTAGALLALGHGLWHRLRRRPGLQPWAPAFTLGAFLPVLFLPPR